MYLFIFIYFHLNSPYLFGIKYLFLKLQIDKTQQNLDCFITILYCTSGIDPTSSYDKISP